MTALALDIGPGAGALVLYPDEAYRGSEIEISRVGDERRVHTGVLDRTGGERTRLTAVFGSLPAGDYVIWRDASTVAATVTVTEGAVTELAVR